MSSSETDGVHVRQDTQQPGDWHSQKREVLQAGEGDETSFETRLGANHDQKERGEGAQTSRNWSEDGLRKE